MAKVTITIEDMPGNRVKFVMDPSFEKMMMMQDSGHSLTSAQAYAIFAANHVRAESKRRGPTPILIPPIGRY